MRRSRTGQRGRGIPRPFEVHALEARRYFADHTVNGTDGNDTIVVDFVAVRDHLVVNEWHVTVNGAEQVFQALSPQIRGLDGNDTITVLRTRPDTAFLEVFGNSGDDTITVGGGNIDANIFLVHVEGDGGTDTVVVDDRSGDTAVYTVGVGLPGPGTDLFFDGSANLSLSDDVQTLRLLCDSTGFNDVNIRENEGMGLDRIEVRGGTRLDTVNYIREGTDTVVDFDGGGGTGDRFEYHDGRFVNTARTIVLEPGRLISEGGNRAAWRNVEIVDAIVHGAADTVNVNGVAAGDHVTFSAEEGAQTFSDTYNVGNGDVDGNILGELVFDDRGAADDRYVFNDAFGTADDAYSINLLTFQKTGLASGVVMGGGAPEVVVTANAGDNTIEVFTSIADDYRVTVNGGLGDDTIVYGGEHLNASTSTLRGDSGTDTIVFNDTGPLRTGINDKDYTFLTGVLRYFENGFVKSSHAYDAETAVVNSGAYDSTFTVLDTGGEATLTLNGGDGADRLALAPFTTPTSFVFNGQGGADDIEIDDTDDTVADTYTLTKTTFDKSGFSLLTHGTTETILLRGHTSNNTFDVNGVAAGTAVTIVAGNSSDLFRVGAGDLDSNVSGTLELVGEQGGDRVIFDDTADTGNDSYRLDNGVLTKSNVPSATMEYRFVEHVELNASPANNTVVFASPGFALDVTLRGFAGADTFDVTPSDRATVLIEASDPTVPPGDVLRFSNAAAAGPSVLTPNGAVNGTYAFASAEPVTFLGIETFPLPPAAPSAPDLPAASDTGISPTDNVTRLGSFILTGAAPAGATVTLRDGAAQVASGIASGGGVYSLVVSASEGVHTYTAAVVAADASQLRGNPSPPLVVTVDLTPPSAPDAPDLAAASDTGTSNADNVTRDTTPTFDGRAASGTTAFLLDGDSIVASAVAAGSAFSLTAPPVADGVHSFRLSLQDAAGNTSLLGPALPVRIDTVAPGVLNATFTNQPTARLTFTFDEDVQGLDAQFVTVVNRATGAAISEVVLDYSPNTAVITFPISGRVLPAGNYRATLSDKVGDAAGNDPITNRVFDFTAFAQVQGRRAFYNNSALDGNSPAANSADDAAIATGKTALLPGRVAEIANVTSFSKGINGIMIDAAALPTGGSFTAADVDVHVGNGAAWTPAPPPTAVAVRRGAGASGTDRITLTLPDGTAKNAWLRVTVKATPNTGLATPDVFYFGNLVGDTGSRGAPKVDVLDVARIRSAIGLTSAAALSPCDINRDGSINGADVFLARLNQGRTLPLFTAPASPAAASANLLLPAPPLRISSRPVRRGPMDGPHDVAAGVLV